MSEHKREEELVVIKVLENDSSVSDKTGGDIAPDLESASASGMYIVVHRIVGIEDKTKENEPTKETRVQVDCYGDTKEDANNLADDVEAALKGYSGTTYGTIDVDQIQHESDNPSGFDQKNKRYKASDDYNVKVKV